MSDSDSEGDEKFLTPYGSPSEYHSDATPLFSVENIDVLSKTTRSQTEKITRHRRAGSCTIGDGQHNYGNGNSAAKRRLDSINVYPEHVSSATACTSRSMSLDDSVKSGISTSYNVNWEGTTRQRGVVLVSDGQSK